MGDGNGGRSAAAAVGRGAQHAAGSGGGGAAGGGPAKGVVLKHPISERAQMKLLAVSGDVGRWCIFVLVVGLAGGGGAGER